MVKPVKNHYKSFAVAIILSLGVAYCGDPIPVEEMGNAKYEITKAESVKADQYAKDTYEKARATLFEAHDLISSNKLKEAKDKALEAQKLAQDAYNQAIPELAKQTRTEAEEMIKEADRAFAEELAPEAYENAKKLFETGDEKLKAEANYEAFQAFENSREDAIKARNQAEAQAENLERELTAAEDLIKEAIEYGGMENSPDKINAANDAAKKAHEYLANKFLKDAHGEIQTAKQNATEAVDAAKENYAAKKKLEASNAVEEAERNMVNFKAEVDKSALKKRLIKSDEAQESLKNTEETLSAAQDSLTKAGKKLEDKDFINSIDHSKEAIRLAKMVDDQIPALRALVNQQTVASDHGGTIPPRTIPGWKTYTVRLIPSRRDCLWRIAEYKDIYGNPSKWTRIYKANKSQIKNPDLIFPGQVFDIPPLEGDITKPAVEEKKDIETEGTQKETTIERPRMDGENTKQENGDNSQMNGDQQGGEKTENPEGAAEGVNKESSEQPQGDNQNQGSTDNTNTPETAQ